MSEARAIQTDSQPPRIVRICRRASLTWVRVDSEEDVKAREESWWKWGKSVDCSSFSWGCRKSGSHWGSLVGEGEGEELEVRQEVCGSEIEFDEDSQLGQIECTRTRNY